MEHELQQSRKLQQLLQQQEEMCVSVVTEVERKQIDLAIQIEAEKNHLQDIHTAYRLLGRSLFHISLADSPHPTYGIRFDTSYRGRQCASYYIVVQTAGSSFSILRNTLPSGVLIDVSELTLNLKSFGEKTQLHLDAFVSRQQQFFNVQKNKAILQAVACTVDYASISLQCVGFLEIQLAYDELSEYLPTRVEIKSIAPQDTTIVETYQQQRRIETIRQVFQTLPLEDAVGKSLNFEN